MWRVLADEILRQNGYGLSRPHHYLLGGKSEIGYDRAPGADLTNYGIGFQIGLGCSAYSHLGEYSYQNHTKRERYTDAMEKSRLSLQRGKRLTDKEKELIFVLGNLCSKGQMSAEDYNQKVISQRQEFGGKLQELQNLGAVEKINDQFRLTSAGTIYFDEIGLFLWPEKMRQIYLQECGRER
jgi:coproporphyrinogen III oxidase-like Fe-S oxidoreductase